MSDHVFARVSGYFLTILPHAPFHYRQSSIDERTLVLKHTTTTTCKQAHITINDGYHVTLSEGTRSLDEVADLDASPHGGTWKIETSIFSVAWPDGFELFSTPDPPGFELLGPNDTLIYPQGPFHPTRLPAFEDMCGPGQRIIAQGTLGDVQWIELAYDHEGQLWFQRHYLAPLTPQRTVVIMVQAPQEHAGDAVRAVEYVTQSCAPFTPEGS